MGRPSWLRLMGSAVLFACLVGDANAQYFGRNKVQYDRETVRILATEHFDVYYAAPDAEAAAIVGRLAERWHGRLTTTLRHALRGRQPIILYGSHRRFEQTNVYAGLIDESTGGFTDARKRRIVLPLAASLAETDHVLGHEIVHAFQFDIADEHRSPLALPLWFIEGMAEYLTLGGDDPQTAMWMRDAVRGPKLPTIREIGSSRYFPYRWGAAVWSHLTRAYGDDLPARALRAKRDVKRRLEGLTGRSLDELSSAWHADLRERFAGEAVETVATRSALITRRDGGGRLNLAASLSPDGTRVVYLSERDQFSLDLFLADARTGDVIRKLITTAANARFESLQYLHSAGSWDREGTRFAIATIVEGRPAVLVLGIDRPADRRELPLEQFDEVYSPSWSPDGRSIAFSAMRGGVTDLFTIEIATGAITQLTADAYADLQPSWSPDGKTIAFTTDRFTSNLARLSFGDYRIGLIDVSRSSSIVRAPAALAGNHLDPAWSPDGTSVYFVADPGGASNVYRLERTSGRVFKVTGVETGVSGVTRVSPALSVAADAGTLAFSVFRHNGFEVHAIDSRDELVGDLVEPAVAAVAPLAPLIADLAPVPSLPALAPAPRAHSPYRPRLSLEAIGTPYFSAGGGPLGSYVAGGASLLFGDLLGDHQLLATGYVSSRFDESAVGMLYVNRRSRWNWGVTFEQSPELRLRTISVRAAEDRERAVTRERERMLWTNRQVGAFTAYPLNRSRRLELNGGFTQIAVTRELRTELLATTTGLLLEHETERLPSMPSVGLISAGVALVGDSAIFGATGPMLGSRYRFETTTHVGGLSYVSVLADYRRYTMPVRPFTFAMRVVHSGRYGGDAGDLRLRDAYVGSTSLVRGYGLSTVARSECPRGSADCPALNTLLANRFVAAKMELRVPLWSTMTTTSRVAYGPLPVDAFVFADAGAGWGGEQRFGSGGADGVVVRSVGAGVRVNLYGFVAEIAAVRPLDLARSRWSFGLNVRPGF